MSGPGGRARLSAEEWKWLEPLLDAVLDAPPEHRAALIARSSGGDAGLHAQLERLAAECERPHPLLDTPATGRFASRMLSDAPSIPEQITDRYRVLREVGRGGMAVVYLARDLKHDRDVAVKVVRPELAAAIGRTRFLHEIAIAARLRHPHIVPLYDSGEVAPETESGEPLLYYVMPYEVGHSLRDRLVQEVALSVAEVLLVVRDLCEALSHAHQHGIVHRDIKPDNVLLSGRHALISDFGVARAVTEAVTPATAGSGSTALGTPAYMAPEQFARGTRVDHRADLFALGVLTYELLVGTPPQSGGLPPQSEEQVADAMDALRARRPDVPQALVDAIAKCIMPRPEDRWASADELLAQLPSVEPSTTVAAPGNRRKIRIAVVGVAMMAASLVALAFLSRGLGADALLRLGRATQLTSERGLEVQPTFSPNGRRVAYAVGNSLRMRIAVRDIAGGPAHWLTDSAVSSSQPRWSPDGARVLFLAHDGAFSVSATGGSAREEVPAVPGVIVRSAAWSTDGREIAYTRGDSLLVRTIGTNHTRLVTSAPDLHSCAWSPDDAWIACVAGNSFHVTVGGVSGIGPMFGNLAPSRIVLIPSIGGRAISMTDSITLNQSPAWSPSGQTLYFVSNRNGPRDVYALDVRSHSPSEPVRVTTGLGAQSIALSADGARIAYAAYSTTANVWAMPIPAHPPGSLTSATPVTAGNQTVEGVRVSADGHWLVYDSDRAGTSAVYRVPIAGGDVEQLTHDSSDDFRGSLSPDERELVYHSFRTGARNIFLLTLGSGLPRQLTRSDGRQLAMANWSPNGTALSMFDLRNADALVMRRDRQGRWSAPHVVASDAWRPEWSPDGRTIAFVSPSDGRIGLVSADSGPRRDLYVPRAGDPAAELALFAPNGHELYFKSHDASGRASFWSIPVSGGRPRLLVRFDDPSRSSNRFDFASDGRRLYFTLEDRESDLWVADVARR